MNKILSPGEAIALGELLMAISAKKKIKWLDTESNIVKGELRSLVMGPNNFAMLAWGTDVRDAWVWITANGFERTESVERLVMLSREGGLMFDES